MAVVVQDEKMQIEKLELEPYDDLLPENWTKS
jgi:hypothetical protein